MMENYVIGNVVINSLLLAIVVFGIRHWMRLVEDRARTNAMRIEETAHETKMEIKDAIAENRYEYRQQSSEIKQSIDKLTDRVGLQNGRVGKLETTLAEQVAACKIRQLQHRKEDA